MTAQADRNTFKPFSKGFVCVCVCHVIVLLGIYEDCMRSLNNAKELFGIGAQLLGLVTFPIDFRFVYCEQS